MGDRRERNALDFVFLTDCIISDKRKVILSHEGCFSCFNLHVILWNNSDGATKLYIFKLQSVLQSSPMIHLCQKCLW